MIQVNDKVRIRPSYHTLPDMTIKVNKAAAIIWDVVFPIQVEILGGILSKER